MAEITTRLSSTSISRLGIVGIDGPERSPLSTGMPISKMPLRGQWRSKDTLVGAQPIAERDVEQSAPPVPF